MPAYEIIDLNSGRRRGVLTDPTLHRSRYEDARSPTKPAGDGWLNVKLGWYDEDIGFPSDRWIRVHLDVPADEAVLVIAHDTGDEDPTVGYFADRFPTSHGLWTPSNARGRVRWSREPGCEPPNRWRSAPEIPASNFDRWRDR